MPANQRYSTRIHSRRQLDRVREHIAAAAKVFSEIQPRYEEALPRVSKACEHLIDMLSMIDALVEDIKENI